MNPLQAGISSNLIHDHQTNEGKLLDSFRAVYENQSLKDPYWTPRLISKISIIVISAVGDIPFIAVSMPLGKVLGPICAAGNCANFFIFNWWATKDIISAAFGAKTAAHIELTREQRSKQSTCKTIGLATAISLIAILSQLPGALAAMEYNEKKYKIAAGLVLLIGGALLPIRSLQLASEQIAAKLQNSEEARIRTLKEGMVALLNSCHAAFIKKSPEEKASFIQKCKQLTEEAAQTEKTDAYMFSLLQQDETLPPDSVQEKIRLAFNGLGFITGAVLALMFGYASTQYTFAQTKKQILDNNTIGGVFAALTLICKCCLVGISIIKTNQRIFNVCGNALTGNETRNLSWQLKPKLSTGLATIGLLINTIALGPNYVLWGDFYNKNQFEHKAFQYGICSALFLLFFTSSLDIVNEVVSSSLSNGTEEEKEILKINEGFKQFKTLVEECPNEEFVAYLGGNGRTQQDLRRKLGIITDSNYGTSLLQGQSINSSHLAIPSSTAEET